MPSHKDAKKRHSKSLERRARNRHYRGMVRTHVKRVRRAAAAGDAKAANEALKSAVPAIGKVASKGVIPKRKASRLISRLTKRVNALSR